MLLSNVYVTLLSLIKSLVFIAKSYSFCGLILDSSNQYLF